MSNEAPTIVAKLWNFCNVLRDDGVSYGDYVQQLTNLLFLKMADEQTKPPFNRKSFIPKKYDWTTLTGISGDALAIFLRDTQGHALITEFFSRALGSNEMMRSLKVEGFVKAKQPGAVLASNTRAILRMAWSLRICHGTINSLVEPCLVATNKLPKFM